MRKRAIHTIPPKRQQHTFYTMHRALHNNTWINKTGYNERIKCAVKHTLKSKVKSNQRRIFWMKNRWSTWRGGDQLEEELLGKFDEMVHSWDVLVIFNSNQRWIKLGRFWNVWFRNFCHFDLKIFECGIFFLILSKITSIYVIYINFLTPLIKKIHPQKLVEFRIEVVTNAFLASNQIW